MMTWVDLSLFYSSYNFLLLKDIENEYGGSVNRNSDDVEPETKTSGVKDEEDLEEGGLC